MFVTKSIPFSASLRKGVNAFQACNFLELSANGLRCITFKIKDESSYQEDGDYDGDIIPITFPAKMKRFLKPDSTEGKDFIPETAAPGTYVPIDLTTSNLPITTFLLHGMTKRSDPISNVFEQSLYGNHACAGPLWPTGNGQACSTKPGVGTLEEPVVFYLKMDFGVGKKPDGLWKDKLDHFLIPTILPNRTILWIAIDNVSGDSGEKNMEAIKEWTSKETAVSSSGQNFFIDEAGIMITMERNNIGKKVAFLK